MAGLSFLKSMKRVCSGLAVVLVLSATFVTELQAADVVTTKKDDSGWKLQVNGEDFYVKGVVWGYSPRNQNYSYNLLVRVRRLHSQGSRLRLRPDEGGRRQRDSQLHDDPAEVGDLHLPRARHHVGDQPADGPLRLHHRRQVGAVYRLFRPADAGDAAERHAGNRRPVQGYARRADVRVRQREQLRPVLVQLRDREPARRRAEHGQGALPVQPVQRGDGAGQEDRAESSVLDRQRRHPVHRPDQGALHGHGCARRQRLSRPELHGAVARRRREARPSRRVLRVRQRCIQRPRASRKTRSRRRCS